MSEKIISEIERIAAIDDGAPEWVRQLRMANMAWFALDLLNEQQRERERKPDQTGQPSAI
jgi:hypothetical protein